MALLLLIMMMMTIATVMTMTTTLGRFLLKLATDNLQHYATALCIMQLPFDLESFFTATVEITGGHGTRTIGLCH